MKKNIVAVFIFTIILCLSGCGLFEKDTQSNADALRKTIEAGQTTTVTTNEITKTTSISSENYENIQNSTVSGGELYSIIPTDSYYDNNKYKSSVKMLYYLSDLELTEENAVSVTIYGDGTGVFFLSKNSAIIEKGSIIITESEIQCKYDSGKYVTLESLNESDDFTEIDFKVLDNGELINYHCYLYMTTDDEGNIIDGISYKDLHVNTN